MQKVMVVAGTRPKMIKLAPVVRELEKYPAEFKVVVVITAQHRQMLDQAMKLVKISPSYDLNIMEENQDLPDTAARMMEKFDSVVKKEESDLILVQRDTITSLICALTGSHHKIRVGHIEVGLRTYDKYHPFPEKINRHLISVITGLHFAPTERARQNLPPEGIPEENIFVTGNTVIDALFMTLDKLKKDKLKLQSLNSQFSFLSSNSKFILATAHRRKNFGNPLQNICLALKEIIKYNDNLEIIYPVHLNPNIQEPVKRILKDNQRIHLTNPLDYESFVWLMEKSYSF